jgi:hypothetical protein
VGLSLKTTFNTVINPFKIPRYQLVAESSRATLPREGLGILVRYAGVKIWELVRFRGFIKYSKNRINR